MPRVPEIVVYIPEVKRPEQILSEAEGYGLISSLSPKQKAAVEMRNSGLRFKDISEKLGLSPQRSRELYHSGIKNIAVQLKKY